MADGFGDPGGPGGPERDPEVSPELSRLLEIDPDAPVSGHQRVVATKVASLAPEHDWGAARERIFPELRPVGTAGAPGFAPGSEVHASPVSGHTQPLLVEGPAGLPIVFAMAASGFDILVNGDHLLSWGIEADAVQEAAMANLAAWSSGAPWTDETDGDRRLLSSDTGDGWDASRILLPQVRQMLSDELGHAGRVLVGLPERHLLLAGSLGPDDTEFEALFRDFVIQHSSGAEEPIDRRVFELVEGGLVELSGA